MNPAEKFADSLTANRLVATLRGVSDQRLEAVAVVLAESGVKLIEVALSDPAAVCQVGLLRKYLSDDVQVGAGTVVTTELAQAATDEGASFLVTPHVSVDVISFAAQQQLGLLCGVMTPTEIMTARSHGARFLKLFPAAVLGPQYVKHRWTPPFGHFLLVLRFYHKLTACTADFAWAGSGHSAVPAGSRRS